MSRRTERWAFVPSRKRPSWGRPAQSPVPVGLGDADRRTAAVLAGYGGLSAATIYARLNLAACNVDRAAFERFTEFVRERAGLHAPDGASTRVEALAQLIVGHLALSGGRAFGVDVVRAIGYRLGVQLEGGKQT